MSFSAGASNAANAVAPLVGNGAIDPDAAILLAVGAISLGGFTIARRTLDTVGDDITDLPILAAVIVSTVGATIITVLSWLGIPASLAVSTTCCIIGLGWGRASRARTLAEIAAPLEPEEPAPEFSTGALNTAPAEGASSTSGSTPTPHLGSPTVGDLADREPPETERMPMADVPDIGEETPDELSAESLFNPEATARIVTLWIVTPALSVLGAFVLFSLLGM